MGGLYCEPLAEANKAVHVQCSRQVVIYVVQTVWLTPL